MKAEPANIALMVHLATLKPLFLISVANTAPFCESNFLRQSILAFWRWQANNKYFACKN